MPCSNVSHLVKQLDANDIRPSKSDVLTVVCGHCDSQEVCPSTRDDLPSEEECGDAAENGEAQGSKGETHSD